MTMSEIRVDRTPAVSDSWIATAELPSLIRVETNLIAAAFSLMKLLPARFMIDAAEAEGLVTRGTTIVETSSGTLGLGLALVCAARGYPLCVVGDPIIDAELRMRLELLGARVDIVSTPATVGGFQTARLDRVAEVAASVTHSFIPSQYDNPNAVAAYELVADDLARSLGRVDCIVATVGSGSSAVGVSHGLRQAFGEQVRLIGVDTHGSVLFGQDDRPRLLRGAGNSIVPGNTRHTAFDEIHWLSPELAFAATRQLYIRTGMFRGPTSGAANMVARWYAHRHAEEVVVALFPDEGYRYQSTVYNDGWIMQNCRSEPTDVKDPTWVDHPRDASESWSAIMWKRRTLDDVLSTE